MRLLALCSLLLVLSGPEPPGGGAAAATARRTVATSRWHARQVLQTAAADADTQSLDLGSTQPPTPALQLPPSDTQQQQQQEQQQQQLQPAAGTEFECDIPGCTACFTVPGAPSVCTRCAAALFILRDKTCGCPPGTFSDGPFSCRDCFRGAFCPGGSVASSYGGTPPAIACSTAFGAGLTTLGARSSSKLQCVNSPGYAFTTVGDSKNPLAVPCGVDTYSPGFKKQRACVPCPDGLTTSGATLATSMQSCDVSACAAAPCGRNALCQDLPPPAPATAEGRTCVCWTNTSPVDDTFGCADPGETQLIGGPLAGSGAALESFYIRCPPGAFITAISGSVMPGLAGTTVVQAVGSQLLCSDGTGGTAQPPGIASGSTWTTALSPEGFTGFTITAPSSVLTSIKFARTDTQQTRPYGVAGDPAFASGVRQSLGCTNYGVAVGLYGLRSAFNAPVKLGLVCSGQSCSARVDTLFGPPGAARFQSPANYLGAAVMPRQTFTASQCCSACTSSFSCVYWVRQASSGLCWLIPREPVQEGLPMPGTWGFQDAPGWASGLTQTKASGISTAASYVGCFTDSPCTGERRLDANLLLDDGAMTTGKCVELGLRAGFSFIGLAPGAAGTTSCYGGNRLPTTPRNPWCSTPCSGQPNERCGDTSGCGISVYSVLKPRQPASTLDTGNTQRQSGWFDVQCQGANNDFCRWLPSSAGIQGEYWSCALAGSDSPSTLPGEFSDSFTINSTCEEQGYRGRPRTDLSCDGPNLSAPSGNGCRTRQCCKARCDESPSCTGFVFGDAMGCRSDGRSCCWVKTGTCEPIESFTLSSWTKGNSVSCTGMPPDPRFGIMFCPQRGPVPGSYPAGTKCTAECTWGIATGSQQPYAVCRSEGTWSDVVGLCKPQCELPPELCA